jgi:hypothetical protein
VSLNGELGDLRRQKARLVVEIRSILESHRRLLDTQAAIDEDRDAGPAGVDGRPTSSRRT